MGNTAIALARCDHDYTLDDAYQKCKRKILSMKDRSHLPLKKIHFMNPELYDQKASQDLLELLVKANYRSNKELNIFLERKADPDTKDILGKSIMEYMFEQKQFPIIVKMLKCGATLPKSILKKCMTRNIIGYLDFPTNIEIYNEQFFEATTCFETLSNRELLDMLDLIVNLQFKTPILSTIISVTEFKIKRIERFIKSLDIYEKLLDKCIDYFTIHNMIYIRESGSINLFI